MIIFVEKQKYEALLYNIVVFKFYLLFMLHVILNRPIVCQLLQNICFIKQNKHISCNIWVLPCIRISYKDFVIIL